MRIQNYSPITLMILLMVAVLMIKVYQHNRLVYLTYSYQKLARQHAQTLSECQQLRTHYDQATKKNQRHPSMPHISLKNVVALDTVLQNKE